MRYRNRLRLLITPPLLGLLCIGFYAATKAQSTLKEQVLKSANASSQEIMLEIERSLTTPIEEWTAIASSTAIQQSLQEANLLTESPEWKQAVLDRDNDWINGQEDKELFNNLINSNLANDLRTHIQSRVGDSGKYRYGEVFITCRGGVNVAQSSRTSDYYQADELWWQLAMQDGLYLSEPGHDESADIYSVDLCLRIDDQNSSPMGVIKIVVNLDSITALIKARAELLKQSGVHEVILLTDDGRLIYTSAPTNLPLLSNEYATLLQGEHALRSIRNLKGISSDAFGVVSSFQDAPLTGWRTLVLWDEKTLFASTKLLRWQILAVATTVIILTAFAAMYIARSMENRIAKIAMTATACTHGNRECPEPDMGADEIGDLSRALCSLIQSLDSNERSLRDERALLESVISTIPFHVYWRNADLQITGCNSAFAHWIGCEHPSDVIGKDESLSDIIPSDLLSLFTEDSSILEKGHQILHDEREFARHDGSTTTIQVSKLPLVDDQGKLHGLLGGFVDITEIKKLQTQLHQAQKLESIGQLAAGIAHEINTPAQYVGDNTRFLQNEFTGLLKVIDQYAEHLNTEGPQISWEDRFRLIRATLEEVDYEFIREEIPQAITQSIEGIDRITGIVKAMKDFSHPGSESTEPADLNAAIQSTATVCSNRWKYVADIEYDLDPELGPVPCYLAEFNQVMLNLIVNAADAIESFTKDSESKGLIKISTKESDGKAVISVVDNGGGMPESVLEKIFDPFFTTKVVGKGTGQGLSISHDVITNKHGGSIECSSEEGIGTTFVIQLPTQGMAQSTDKAA